MDIHTEASGFTPTEKHLAELCRGTFLKMWTYPNPFRDQGQGSTGDGKELCDVMVVFGNHVLLFSDKSIAFNEEVELKVAWKRWYRKAVADSAKQLQGAERWIRSHPDRLYRDRQCKDRFHVPMPDLSELKVHKIVVANGASEASKRFFGGSSGSLMVSSKTEEFLGPIPFTLAQPIENDFFHILDDVSLKIVLEYLDTPSDLIEYLEATESLFLGDAVIHSAGEEETLGIYLQTIVEEKHGFNFGQVDGVSIDEGWWDVFLQSDLLKSKTEADFVSYVWDEILRESTESYVDGTAIIHTEGSQYLHQIHYHLALPSRLYRRVLGEKLRELQVDRQGPRKVSVVPIDPSGKIFCVLLVLSENQFPSDHSMTYDKFRFMLLNNYIVAAMHKEPTADVMVGVAMNDRKDGHTSEDLALMKREQWNEELTIKAIDLIENYSYLKHAGTSIANPYEYPSEQKPEIVEA